MMAANPSQPTQSCSTISSSFSVISTQASSTKPPSEMPVVFIGAFQAAFGERTRLLPYGRVAAPMSGLVNILFLAILARFRLEPESGIGNFQHVVPFLDLHRLLQLQFGIDHANRVCIGDHV